METTKLNENLLQVEDEMTSIAYEKPEIKVFAVEDVVRFGSAPTFDGVSGGFPA